MFEGKLKRYIQIHPVIFKITACEFEVDSRVKKSITGMQSDDK